MAPDPSLRAGLELHRYTITSEGASKGYFRLVEDPAGAWCQWAEVADLLRAQPPDLSDDVFRQAVQKLAEYAGPLSITGRPANPFTEVVVNREWFERCIGVLTLAGKWLRAQPPPAPDPPDDVNRCAICGWTLAGTPQGGCVRGSCSQRPFPNRFYAPARAKAEYSPHLDRDSRVAAPPAVEGTKE